MSDYKDLIDRYIAIWNETDVPRRREMIAKTWMEDACYVDPLMRVEGHAGIDAAVHGVQEQFAGYRFSLLGDAEGYADRVRFSWELTQENGMAFARGTDFGIVTDGRLEEVTGFLDMIASPVNGGA